MAKEVKSLKQIHEEFDLSPSRLHKATMLNEFPFFRLGSQKVDAKKDTRKIFVFRDDIIKWLTQNRVPSKSEIEAQSAIPA